MSSEVATQPRVSTVRRWVFLSGVFGTTIAVVVARRRLFPQQREVVDSLLPLLRSDPEVRAMIGSRLVSTAVQRYKLRYWGSSSANLNTQSVEMNVLVQGELGCGSVCLSAAKIKDRLVFNSILVHLPNQEFLRL